MAADGSSWSFGFPDHVLLDTVARMDRCRNETTAYAETSSGHPIEVSFMVVDPPAVTRWVAHCSALTADEFLQVPPCITGADGAFLLVRVVAPRRHDRLMSTDVFVYRAGPGKPSLQPLPRPYPVGLRSNCVGVLSRGEHCLVVVPELKLQAGQLSYHLHVLSTETGTTPLSWTTRVVELPAAMKACYVALRPTKVFSVQGGSLAWVDLRNGIMLCDLIAVDPKVLLIQLPALMPINKVEFGPDSDGVIPPLDDIRDVAFRNGRFSFIEVGFLEQDDCSTGWTATMLKRGMGSDEEWEPETCHTVNSADLSPTDSCLPYLPSDIWDSKESRLTLNSVMSSDPTLDQYGDRVFYMSIKVKYNDPTGWVMAVDAENKRVEHVVPFSAERMHICRTLLQCAFSKHLSAPDAETCSDNRSNSTIIREDMMRLVFCAVSILLVQHKFRQFEKSACEKLSKDEVWSLFHTGVVSIMNQHMGQVEQYATNNYLSSNSVKIVWRASEDIKKLLEACNDPSTCTGAVREKIRVAIGALAELLQTLPTEVLDAARKMATAVCTDK